ncbi:hypothetical protein HN592_02405 [Candidatus Woesearchaeota archaeon]|jgi:hypothetical protein|nr:hypothetical protein [Candidatus Woesearchaeota archaeon]MBT4368063.1 hypothetical protein [Candidatus Woesearchaeota archaeon]MBT4712551.1 hypothetical protein [Candidatus Woesearchaeota archaeon]MBT6639464.1 hypothetical protein [Candidatus Woesearchaeota archaeon]MBT7133636.1 hypothetical protein [Candidatus Woesearchaeota archaeon]
MTWLAEAERDELGLEQELTQEELSLHHIPPEQRPSELVFLLEDFLKHFQLGDEVPVSSDLGNVVTVAYEGGMKHCFLHYDAEDPRRVLTYNAQGERDARVIPAFICCQDLMMDDELLARYGVVVTRKDAQGFNPHFYEHALILSKCGEGNLRTSISFEGLSHPTGTSMAMDELTLATQVTERLGQAYGVDAKHFIAFEVMRDQYYLGEQLRRTIAISEAFDHYLLTYANGARCLIQKYKPEIMQEVEEHSKVA